MASEQGARYGAILIPSPPKTASQTLVGLLSSAAAIPVIRPKSHGGLGNLVLAIPPVSRLEKAGLRFGGARARKHVLLYGHYPASRHNLRQISRRYEIGLCCMPLRPLAGLLCSLINHTSTRMGPLDPKILDFKEGCSFFDQLSHSELFELMAIRYLAPLQTIVDGWIHVCRERAIPMFVFPFESTISRQEEIASLLVSDSVVGKIVKGRVLPVLESAPEVQVNVSAGLKVRPDQIAADTRARVLQMAARIFDRQRSMPELAPIHDYLMSDLMSVSGAPSDAALPLVWRLGSHRAL